MTLRHWEGLSLLDALRPDPDQELTCAVLTTYGADLVAVVAAILALAGLDDHRGSGSKVDFAQAVEQLRGKVGVLVQSGRMSVPRKAPRVMALLDQFIREVWSDEEEGSWHPKLALVRYASIVENQVNEEGGKIEWRLWISSRNLTRDMSWDAGMLLTGEFSESGNNLSGIREAARELFALASFAEIDAEVMLEELSRVFWTSPKGADVEDFLLMLPDSDRGLPTEPEGVEELILVSPFLDGATVGALGRWGDKNTSRFLLSTVADLQRLAAQSGKPLEGFRGRIGYLDAPEDATTDTLSDDEAIPTIEKDSEELLLEGQGLHTKLIYARHAGGQTLWLGSPNATRRGWAGPNTESVAKLRLTDPAVLEGLRALLEMAQSFDPDMADGPVEDPEEVKVLEKARNQVAARWEVLHRYAKEGSVFMALSPPHPDDERVELYAGLLGSDSVLWPRREAQLNVGVLPPYELTRLCRVRIQFRDACLEWVQTVAVEPEPGLERDRQLLARHLDAKTFLIWIRSLLQQNEILDGGGEWWQERRSEKGGAGSRSGLLSWAPTLEDVLKSWTRNPQTLVEIDRKVRHYLEILQSLDEADWPAEEQAALEEFWTAWQILAAEFLPRDGANP